MVLKVLWNEKFILTFQHKKSFNQDAHQLAIYVSAAYNLDVYYLDN